MNFKETLKYRRSYYHLTNSSPVSDEAIREILEFVPPAQQKAAEEFIIRFGLVHKNMSKNGL